MTQSYPLNPGDEVILFEPYYGYHINTILCDLFSKKRDNICSTLTKVALTPSIPQGAYYVLADISRLPGRTSKDKAMFILEKTGVASVPDEAFFHKPGSSQFVRFCFAKEDNELAEACRRLEALGS